MNDRIVTVFGGTGFLGSRVVRHLREHGLSVRIASRNPDRGQELRASQITPWLQIHGITCHPRRRVDFFSTLLELDRGRRVTDAP